MLEWSDITEEHQEILIEWFNCTEVTADDKEMLAEIYHNKEIDVDYCFGECGRNCFNASGITNWVHWQGTGVGMGDEMVRTKIGPMCGECFALEREQAENALSELEII